MAGGQLNMNKKVIFIIALVLLFAATAITFAVTSATTTVTISAAGISGDPSSVKTLDDVGDTIKLKYSTGGSEPYTHVAPSWSPVVGETGAVTAGDVYYIDTTDYLGDILVTVFLTNTDELIKDYSYLNLQINVWAGTSGDWDQSNMADGSSIGTVYLTLTGGYATFILSGNTEYCIAVDDGNYYCIDTDAAGGSLSPDFYLDTKPL
jgi:hypothetical protein